MSDAPDRYGFEAFDCAPALRLQANERLTELHFKGLRERQDRLEEMIQRLEKRLWLAVYGVVGAILVQAFLRILAAMP